MFGNKITLLEAILDFKIICKKCYQEKKEVVSPIIDYIEEGKENLNYYEPYFSPSKYKLDTFFKYRDYSSYSKYIKDIKIIAETYYHKFDKKKLPYFTIKELENTYSEYKPVRKLKNFSYYKVSKVYKCKKCNSDSFKVYWIMKRYNSYYIPNYIKKKINNDKIKYNDLFFYHEGHVLNKKKKYSCNKIKVYNENLFIKIKDKVYDTSIINKIRNAYYNFIIINIMLSDKKYNMITNKIRLKETYLFNFYLFNVEYTGNKYHKVDIKKYKNMIVKNQKMINNKRIKIDCIIPTIKNYISLLKDILNYNIDMDDNYIYGATSINTNNNQIYEKTKYNFKGFYKGDDAYNQLCRKLPAFPPSVHKIQIKISNIY